MRAQEFITEGFLGEADASAVQFRTASTDNYQSSFTVTAIADGKNVGHFSFYRDPETEDVHNQAEVTDDVRGKGYGKALLLKAIEVANDHGLGFQEDSQSLSRAQSRVYDSLYDAGWIVDADGYWLLTPEGEQELARLSTIQQGVAEGKLSVDVPNEEWLQDKIDYAKSKGRNSYGVPYMGSTTAGVVGTPPRVRVMRLASLPGMRNEQMNVRRDDLKWLMDYMERTGKLPPMGSNPDQEYLPFVMVAYNGEAWVNEGNHRIMAAYRLNWQDMPVEIRYFDGGERIKDGPMYPGKIGLGEVRKESVREAFDQPYKTKSEKSEYGDIDMLARLPDGSNLSIMFNRENNENDTWGVEFYRNNSQEVTGEGDAQRIFATVLAAIQKFIKKHKPQKLFFSASKEIDPTLYYGPDDTLPNPESRAKLYDRLVQRYAKAWGYRAFRADNGALVRYELSRLGKSIAEGNEPGEYVYHASYLPNQSQGLRSVIGNGLKPSETGYAGPGVYFAYKPEDCYYHVGKDEATMFRVRWLDLLKLYGKYPDNKNGIERDDNEIIVPGTVPAKILEVEYFPGEWWDLGSAYQASLGPVDENFADGKKPGRKGLAKRVGVNTKASVSSLRKTAKNSSGEKQRMAHWLANMKAGKKK